MANSVEPDQMSHSVWAYMYLSQILGLLTIISAVFFFSFLFISLCDEMKK